MNDEIINKIIELSHRNINEGKKLNKNNNQIIISIVTEIKEEVKKESQFAN